MADIVNLNRFRKQKTRREAEEQAARNRVRFGRTRAQRELDEAREQQDAARHEVLRRESPDQAGAESSPAPVTPLTARTAHPPAELSASHTSEPLAPPDSPSAE